MGSLISLPQKIASMSSMEEDLQGDETITTINKARNAAQAAGPLRERLTRGDTVVRLSTAKHPLIHAFSPEFEPTNTVARNPGCATSDRGLAGSYSSAILSYRNSD